MARFLGLCVVRMACFEWTFVSREIPCLRMGCGGLPFPDQLTVGPWGRDRSQGEHFQGGVRGDASLSWGWPPSFGGPGSVGCQAPRVLPVAHLPYPQQTFVRTRSLSRGLCPLPSRCLSPASFPSPLLRLNFESLGAQGSFVPGFPGLSLCTSGHSPYLVFINTSFGFPFLSIQGGNLK